MGCVLVVDDEAHMRYAVKLLLRDLGHDAVLAQSAKEALEQVANVDMVITDYSMPDMHGIELLRAIRELDPGLPVVLLTAHGSERLAVEAMKAGAYDYLSKPFEADDMALVVRRAMEARELRVQNRRLSAEKAIGRNIVANSPEMQRVLRLVERIGPRDIPVLVRGETGTGKELIASLLHASSQRAQGPFVRFNCAAIPGELAEAELFGHARGAFTGATQARQGFFAEADGGTLVLDEVGELPLSIQPKLLRVLQDGEIQPVGTGKVQRVDVRVVACTNRDLAAEVRAGRFREDLYFRVAVMDVEVPPLRERASDIPALAAEFCRRYAEQFGLHDVRLSPELVARLEAMEWPGNVRQLENTIARAVALSGGGGEVGPGALPGEDPAWAPSPVLDAALSFREQMRAFERTVIMQALSATGGNQVQAARRLRMSRTAFLERIRRHGLRS